MSYGNLTAIFSLHGVQQLGDLKYLMAWCGALGCEFLKNFALNGMTCSFAGAAGSGGRGPREVE